MQEQVSAKLIAFEQGGFRGDYSVGLTEAYKLLVKELPVDEPEPQPDTVNLIGFSMGSYRALSDRPELERLLEEAFGLKIGACLCGETGIEKIEQMGGAALNLVLREEGLPAAQMLKTRFGTPIGRGRALRLGRGHWTGSKRSRTPSADDQPRPPGRNRRKARGRFPVQDVSDDAAKDRPAVTVIGEYRAVLGVSGFFESLGLPVENKISLHSVRSIPNPDPSVKVWRQRKGAAGPAPESPPPADPCRRPVPDRLPAGQRHPPVRDACDPRGPGGPPSAGDGVAGGRLHRRSGRRISPNPPLNRKECAV